MNDMVAVLKAFFTEAGWLVPAAVSVAMQLILTQRLKPFLPIRWGPEFRDAMIWLMSSTIGILIFVPMRWAWLTLQGKPFAMANFVLAFGIGVIIVAAVPWVYSKLPDSVRQPRSYRTLVKERDSQ